MAESYFFTDAEGKILGPRTVEEIRTFFETGFIEPDAQVCVEGGDDWIPLARFLRETAPAAEEVTASETAPQAPTAVPESPEAVAAGGVSLRSLLTELTDRPLNLERDRKPLGAISIEHIGVDVLTVALASDGDVLHLPIAALRGIRENLDAGETTLEFS